MRPPKSPNWFLETPLEAAIGSCQVSLLTGYLPRDAKRGTPSRLHACFAFNQSVQLQREVYRASKGMGPLPSFTYGCIDSKHIAEK